VNAVHVLTPPAFVYSTPELRAAAIAEDEEAARTEMQKVDSELMGVSHDTVVEWGTRVWSTVEQAVQDSDVDLIVLGTHGRTGTQKLLLGSVAEDVFRHSSVPVLTIGPAVYGGTHKDGSFHRVIFATDFGRESRAAAPYALSLAQENQAQLILLHVINSGQRAQGSFPERSVAEVMHELHTIIPDAAELWCRPEPVVEFGETSKRIVEQAKRRGADLIVMGVRGSAGHLGATRLERATAHKVVVHAPCPVLTVRG
jgi:nucleotide-binding universal stress UspA family protein